MRPESSSSSFLSIAQVAATLGVSRWTVARMLDDGEVPHIKVRGTPRIDRVDLGAWIESQKAKSAARPPVEGPKRPVGRPKKEGIKPGNPRKPSKDNAE